MSQIEVPDWVLEQAFNAWCDVADVDEWRVRNSHEALRAALTAALGAWVVPSHSVTSGIEPTTTLYTLAKEKP